VVRFDSFQRTVEPLTKFVPVTVKLNEGLPAVAEDGFRLVSVGTGFAVLSGDPQARERKSHNSCDRNVGAYPYRAGHDNARPIGVEVGASQRLDGE
jgi:hypothetical protein